MARVRADSAKYDEPLESVHIQIPTSLKRSIRIAAAESGQSMAVLLRESLEKGWETLHGKKKK